MERIKNKLTNPKFLSISFFILLVLIILNMIAKSGASDGTSIQTVSQLVVWSRSGVEHVVSFMASILFYEIVGFPILVLWLVVGGVFFTVRLGFINITLFGHAISVVRGKYSSGDEPGEVTHFQALVAAVSATVGLGNIAGVAIAVTVGGPGAVVWMMIAGFFGMSAKFAEVTLGQKYRTIDEDGKVSGGAFNYLRLGLAEKNLPGLGKILAIIFAIFCIGGSVGAGNLFQANQAVTIVVDSFGVEGNMGKYLIALTMAFFVGVVLVGGIKRIALVAEAIVPLMALIYIVAGLVVVFYNIDKIGEAFSIMFSSAFTGAAVGGGVIGAIINGFKRSAFSNEAGLGSAPIAHSAAKTNEPVREGCVALLEPFIDTMVICMLTGLIITITGVYQTGDSSATGVLLTSNAFSTVISWFPMVLSVAVVLFAYSTMITWSYYGERSWAFLFGKKSIPIFHITFTIFVFLGGILKHDDIGLIVDFSDLLILTMAIPNLIGAYILSGMISADVKEYVRKLKNNEFKTY